MSNYRVSITHVDAMLKLLAVMAKDRRYEEILKSDDKKEVGCMCDVAERLERKGIEIGHLEAIQTMIKKDYSKEAIWDLGYSEKEYEAAEKDLLIQA